MNNHSLNDLLDSFDDALTGFEQFHTPEPLEHGRKVMAALLQHPEWPGADAETRARHLFLAGGMALNLYKIKGAASDLDDAIALSTAAANVADAGSFAGNADLANNCRANLSVAMRSRSARTNDLNELRDAINLSRSVVVATAEDDSELARRFSNLGAGLLVAFKAEGYMDDLTEAVAAFNCAFTTSPAPDLASNLAGALDARFRVMGHRSDLETAIDLMRNAIDALPPGHRSVPGFLNNLTIYLAARFNIEGRLQDAHEAVLAATQAVDMTPEGSPLLASRLASLGNLHGLIHARTGAASENAAAVACLEAALENSHGHPEEVARLKINLALSLAAAAGEQADPGAALRAGRIAREALDLISETSPHRVLAVNALSEALRAQGRLTREVRPFLDAADLLSQGLVTVGKQMSDVARIRLNLAHTLTDVFELTNDGIALAEAAGHGRVAISGLLDTALFAAMPSADVDEAARLGNRLAARMITGGDLATATEFLETSRSVRLAADAALAEYSPVFAAAEDQKDYDLAATDLRQVRTGLDRMAGDAGRSQTEFSRLLARAEDLTTRLADLSARANNPIAGRDNLGAIRMATTRTGSTLAYVYIFENIAGVVLAGPSGYHHLALPGMDRASEELRRGDQYSPADLAKAVADGTIGSSDLGWLPAYALVQSGELSGPDEDAIWRRVMSRIMNWLGSAFAEPLLAFLRTTGAGSVTLLPMGELALLPLHAASAQGKPLFAHLPVRQAPSAALLAIAASRPTASTEHRFAAADAAGDLVFARLEAFDVKRLGGTVVIGAAATRSRIAGGLATAGYSHLAVHAVFNVSAPLESEIDTAPDVDAAPLRLSDLISGMIAVYPGATVVASACETGLFDVVRSPSEQIGFGAAFLAAGAKSAVATLWPVADLSTALIMHRALQSHGRSQTTMPAAIHEACSWLRDATHRDVRAALCEMHSEIPTGLQDLADARTAIDELIAAYPETNAKPFSHPVYWAPFVCMGV